MSIRTGPDPVTTSGATTAPKQSLTPARLHAKDAPASSVQFQFNPRTITVGHGATSRELGAKPAATNDGKGKADEGGNLTTPQVLEKLGKTTFKLSPLVFDGGHVLRDCGQLLTWSYGITPAGSSEQALQLPVLVFAWGQFAFGAGVGSAIEVVVARAEVAYERFNAQGKPIRATVTLDLQPIADNPLRQNPTSGGRPDRRGHVVVAGESIASIAAHTYGRPADWRRLAAANGVDDPLRLRSGSALFLPSPAELPPEPPR